MWHCLKRNFLTSIGESPVIKWTIRLLIKERPTGMKKAGKRKLLTSVSGGLFVMSIAQILSFLIELPDLVRGSLIGIGIGLLLVSLASGSIQTNR